MAGPASGSFRCWRNTFSDKLARPFVDAGFAWDTLEGFGQSVIVV
jgi:hypothetical protein